jgi:type I restriction enzyme S subunit
MAATKNTKAFYNTEIPSDWEVKELGAFVKVKHGRDQKSIEVENGIYPILATGGEIGRTNTALYSKPSVLIGRKGTIDKPKYMDTPFWTVDTLFYTEISEYVLPIWLFYKFETIDWYFYNEASGVPSLSASTISKIKIPLPPLPEQKAIAQVLGTADAAIHTTEKLIAQKVLRKKWLMQQLLTGKKRLMGFGGEWKKVGAGEIFKSITKKGFADEELLSATQDRGMIPRTMLEGRVTMPTSGTEGFKLVEIGDFIISLRSFQGGLEYSYYRGLVSPAYTVLKPKKQINDEFYKQYFKSYEFIGRLATAVIGIRDGKQICYDDFCIVKIPNPTFDEQTAIAQVLQAVDREISLLKAKAEKLREQKKGLMQVLLTGKVRLKIHNE